MFEQYIKITPSKKKKLHVKMLQYSNLFCIKIFDLKNNNLSFKNISPEQIAKHFLLWPYL